MSVPRINLSKAYVQDEHHRQIQSILNVVDQNSNQINTINGLPSYTSGTYKTEIRLGFVYVTSITANLTQQALETIVLVDGTGVTARPHPTTIPFPGSVVALVCDIRPTVAVAQTINLYKNTSLLTSLSVASNAASGVALFPKGSYPFKAGDSFFSTVTFPTASSNSTCTFIKIYVELGT